MPASLPSPQAEGAWTQGGEVGTPGPCGQDKGRVPSIPPKGLPTNAPASPNSCPRGYSKTEVSRVPSSMTTAVHLFQAAPVAVLNSLVPSRYQVPKTGCGGMAFLDSCSESQGMGLWASVWAQEVLESS